MTPQTLRSPYEGDGADRAGEELLGQPGHQLRLFVSLPAYAEAERRYIAARLDGFNKAFAGAVEIAPIGLDSEPPGQDDALGAADCDAVIAVLRPRFPDDPLTAEQAGARGGAAGLVSAMGKGGGAGLPDVHIFRYSESPEQAAADTDWQSGKRAFEAWFRARGGQVLSFDDFFSPDGLGSVLDERLGAWLARLGYEPPLAAVMAFETDAIQELAAEIAALDEVPAAMLQDGEEPADTEVAEPEAEAAEEAPEAVAAEPEPEAAEEPPAAEATEPFESEEHGAAVPADQEAAADLSEAMLEIEPVPAAGIFSAPPAREESAEAVRRDRFRRLTTFLYRRQATYTPPEGMRPEEGYSADEAEDDSTLIVESEFLDLSPDDTAFAAPAALLDDLEPLPEIETGTADTPLEAFAEAGTVEDDGGLIIEAVLVEPVAFLDEPEPVPAVETEESKGIRPEPASEAAAAADDGALLLDTGNEELAVGEEAAAGIEQVALEPEITPPAIEAAPAPAEPEPVPAFVPVVQPGPSQLPPAAEEDRPPHSPKVVPLRPASAPAAGTIAVSPGRGRSAAMLGLASLAAVSLAFAAFAGAAWFGARSTGADAHKRLATATEAAGNLVFNLTDEGRRLGGATSDGSKAIVEKAQRLHGALLAAGGVDTDDVFKRASAKMNEARDLSKNGKSAEALAAAIEGQRLFQTLADLNPGEAEWQKRLAASHLKIGDVLVVQNNLVEALGAYRDTIAIDKALSAQDPDNADERIALAAAQIKAGDVLAVRGRLEEALSNYRDALAIRKTLAQGHANDADRQRDLMEIDSKIADVLSAQNHLDDALSLYRDALGIAAKMALMNPADPRWRDASAKTNLKIGDVLVGKGRVDDALAAYRDGLTTMKDVAANEPHNSEWQNSLMLIHQRIGDAFVTESHFESALASYRDSLAIIQAMVAKDPKNAFWRHNASEAQLRIGQVLFSQNNLDGALAAHRESLSIMKALAAEDPGNSRYQHDLMMGANDIGIILNQKGVRAEALAAYRDAQAIAAAMGAKEPNNSDWAVTRAMIDNNLGALQMDVGNRDDGIAAYRDGLEVSKGLVARDARNAEWQAGLAVALYNLGEAGVDSEANFTQARDLLLRLDNAGALRPDKKALIPHVEDALARMRGGETRKRR